MLEEKEFGEILEYLKGIKSELASLKEKINTQESRLNNLENNTKKKYETQVPETPHLIENKNIVPEPVSYSSPPASQIPTDFSPQETQFGPKAEKKKEGDLEQRIGSRWFARVGITALVLGISFFLKYAFDNNWIGPTGRVIIGILAGVTLLAFGEKYVRKYFTYGQIISGGGIIILYLSIFAAFDFYNLIGQIPAFLFMIVVTGAGIVLSIRYNALSLILLAIIGGFATPFLISTGKNNLVGLFSYVLLLDLAILTVSIFKKWRELNFAGFLGTMFTFMAWAGKFYTKEQLGLTMTFLTLFFITYSISSLVYNLVKKENSTGTEQILTLFSATAYFAASYGILNPDHHIFMGFFALLMAVYYFLWAYLVRGVTPDDKKLYNFLAFLTIGFITLAIPIQFKQNMITIGWTIEAIILIMLGVKTNNDTIKSFGISVFTLAGLRLLLVDSDYQPDFVPIINKSFLTYVFVIFSAYISAYLFKILLSSGEEGKFVQTKQAVAFFIIIANFLSVFSVSREIVFYYKDQERVLELKQDVKMKQIETTPGYISYSNRYSYEFSSDYYEKLKKIENKSSVSLSIFWLIYGVVLMAVGIIRKYKSVRVGGIVLLLLAIFKLFFYDLWSLGTLYRIISSISLGIVLLTISFAYQKYKEKIKQII